MTGEERKIIRDKIFDISIYLILGFIILIPILNNNLFLLDFTPAINYDSLFYGKDIPEYGGSLPLTLISEKILLFIVLFFGAYSMYEFIGKIIQQRTVRFYAGLLYVFNPLTYIRIISGQLFLLFSYALIPLLLKVFFDLLEKKETKEMIKFTILLSIVAFNIHILVMSLIIIGILFLFWFNKHRDNRILKLIILSSIIFVILNSYWIIPVLTAKNAIIDNIGEKDLEVFAPKGGLFDIAAMYGFWRDGYSYAKDFLPGWQILYLIILSLSVVGFISYYRHEKIGIYVTAFAVIGIVGFILASGVNGPFGEIIRWLFENTVLKGFRDSQKFVVMLVLSYSVLGGLGINKIKSIYNDI